MAGRSNLTNVRGGTPSRVYNQRSANKAAQTQIQHNRMTSTQNRNAAALSTARSNYKKAPTLGAQSIIGARVKRLEKRPVR